MLRTSVIALAMTLGISDAASASDLIGLGTAPCSHFNQVRDTANETAYMGWITGWLSGLNAGRRLGQLPTLDFDGMPYPAMVDFVRSYCGSHPKQTMVSAGIALVGQINGH